MQVLLFSWFCYRCVSVCRWMLTRWAYCSLGTSFRVAFIIRCFFLFRELVVSSASWLFSACYYWVHNCLWFALRCGSFDCTERHKQTTNYLLMRMPPLLSLLPRNPGNVGIYLVDCHRRVYDSFVWSFVCLCLITLSRELDLVLDVWFDVLVFWPMIFFALLFLMMKGKLDCQFELAFIVCCYI